MPRMPFPKILALVEGTMERFFIDANFHYVEIVDVQNGTGWSIERLANQIAGKYYLKDMNADFVVVWLDKEKHDCQPSELADIIMGKLLERGADRERTCVCIPDKMTENMILADEDLIRQTFELPDYEYKSEGKNGKHILSTMYNDRGIKYKETSHGAALLKSVRLSRAAAKNAAAARLLKLLSISCWWVGADA